MWLVSALKNLKSEKVFAVVRALEIIGEAARSIPDDMQEKYTEVPWRDVIGMRDKLIHGYFGVSLKRVWDTVEGDLPRLRETILKMLAEMTTDEE